MVCSVFNSGGMRIIGEFEGDLLHFLCSEDRSAVGFITFNTLSYQRGSVRGGFTFLIHPGLVAVIGFEEVSV